MEQHVNSWGNSLGVRLPKSLAKALGLRKGSLVSVTHAYGGALVKPAKRKNSRYTLEELLAKATPQNRPEYMEWRPVGREIIDDDWS